MSARPHPDLNDVEIVAAAEAGTVADILSRAFAADPFWRWMISAGPRHDASRRRCFGAIVRSVFAPQGQMWTSRRRDAAGCWLPPGKASASLATQARMLPSMALAGPATFARMLRVDRTLESLHPHEPHWYLGLLGVSPEAQGSGWGGQLLRAALAGVDAEGMPAYLEASSERSRALYLRHGFEDSGAPIHVGDSPPLYPMWRPAPAPGSRGDAPG